MTVPNALTTSRLVLSPLFFLAYFLPVWVDGFHALGLGIMVGIYAVMEISDVMDGAIARKRDLVSDYGKLMDPFADVISRLTYFICFVHSSIIPFWAFTLIIYREFGIVFLRMIMYRDGTALAARRGGKLKAALYAAGGLVGILVLLARGEMILPAGWVSSLETIAVVVFSLAAVLSLVSFFDYLRVFALHQQNRNDD